MRTFFNKLLPGSLRKRVLYAFVFMSMLPLGLVLFVTGTATRESIITAEYEKAEQMSEQVARELTLYLSKLENSLREIQGDPLFTDPSVSADARKRELERILGANGDFLSLELSPRKSAEEEPEEEITFEIFGAMQRTSSNVNWTVPLPHLGEKITVETALPEIWRILDGVQLGNSGGAILIDSTSKIISHRNKTRLRTYLSPDALKKDAIYHGPDDKSYRTVVTSMDQSQYPFRVVILVPTEPIDALVLEALIMQLLMGCGTTVMAWTLGILISRHLTGGLVKASKVAEVVASGDLTARLPKGDTVEVDQLAVSFNSMIHELESHRNHLEDIVKERTRDLEEATEREKNISAELQATYDAGKDGLWLVNRDGTVVSENAAFRNMFEISSEKGSSFEAVTEQISSHFAEPKLFSEWVQQSFASPNDSSSQRWDLIEGNGVFGGKSSLVTGEDGQPFAILFAFTDFSEETRVQKELEEARRFESVGHLVGSVAHEFNNLLTGVIGNIDFVSDGVATSSSQSDNLAQAKESAAKAVELVRGLLSFSQQNLLQLQLAQPASILKASLREFYNRFGEEALKEVRWRVRIDDDLKLLQADRTKLGQALEQFFENAFEAINGSGVIAVTASNDVSAEGLERICIKIQDNGVGMSPEIVERVFEPFYSTSRNKKGLGLSMCHGIISQHGGELICHSEEGEGTAMVVSLPVSKEQSLPHSKRDFGSGPEFSEAGDEEDSCILVVDDDPLVRTVTSKILEKGNHTVICAEGGREALEIYREHRSTIKLIVLDLRMPEMMGTEVMEKLHESYPGEDIRIVVCSGYLRDYDDEAPGSNRRVKPRAFLQKPVGAQSLLATVDEFLPR